MFREQALLHCTTLFRGQQCFAYPPIVISTEARSRATSEAEKSLTLYDCFCNRHWLACANRTFSHTPEISRLRTGLPRAALEMTEWAACRRSLIPRTGVTALSCPLRGQLFVFVLPPVVISTEARSRATSEAEKSLTLYDCFCNRHWLACANRTFSHTPEISRLRTGLPRAALEMTEWAACRCGRATLR